MHALKQNLSAPCARNPHTPARAEPGISRISRRCPQGGTGRTWNRATRWWFPRGGRMHRVPRLVRGWTDPGFGHRTRRECDTDRGGGRSRRRSLARV